MFAHLSRIVQKMKNVLKHFLITVFLTLFTQVGGALWLLFLPFYRKIKSKMNLVWKQRLIGSAVFLLFYTLTSVFLVPPLAKWQCGRVPLPVFGHPNLKPQNVFYFCLLNHHYVRPTVRQSCENAADKMAAKFPGTKTYYLDANFPFFDGYPLEPHFTHRNGTTVDMALAWLDTQSEKPLLGFYGLTAKPLPGEVDMEEKCNNRWRSIEMRVAEHFYEEKNYKLDEPRTAELIRLFSTDKKVRKILLEPHLKTRLGLGRFDNIRFQGCKAARHDDHFHVIW